MNRLVNWFRNRSYSRPPLSSGLTGARVLGAGRFRPIIEALEDRQLLSASSIAIGGNGDRITLDDNHTLWESIARTGQRVQIASSVRSLAGDGHGHVIPLENNGLLRELFSPVQPSGGTSPWVPIDNNVASFTLADHDQIHVVYDVIGQKWHALQTAGINLGPAQGGEESAFGGRIAFFQNGAIFSPDGMSAVEIHGRLHAAWNKLSASQKQALGAPLGNQNDSNDGLTSMGKFQNGSLYWTPLSGGRIVSDSPALNGTTAATSEFALTDKGSSTAISTYGNLFNPNQELIAYDVTSSGMLSLNVMQHNYYADIDFGDGVKHDTTKMQEAIKREVPLPQMDPLKTLANLAPGSTVTSNYDTQRAALYNDVSHGGADNIFFSSRRFTDWASPEKVAELVAKDFIPYVGQPAVEHEIRDQLLLEFWNLASWAERKWAGGDASLSGLATGLWHLANSLKGGQALLGVDVTYTAGGVKDPHLGFAIRVDGAANPDRLTPNPKDFSTPFDPHVLTKDFSVGVATGVLFDKKMLQDLWANFVGLVGGRLNLSDALLEDLKQSAISSGVDVAVYNVLLRGTGINYGMISQLYQAQGRNPIVDLRGTAIEGNFRHLLTQLGVKAQGNEGAIKIEKLEFNTSTYEFVAKFDLHHRHSWGTPGQTAKPVGQDITRLLKDIYKAGAADAAKVLHSLGAGASDIADALKRTYRTAPSDVARILHDLQVGTNEIARALMAAGAKAQEVARALYGKVTQDANALVNALEAAGVKASDLPSVLPIQILAAIKTAAQHARQAAVAIRDNAIQAANNWGQSQIGQVQSGIQSAQQAYHQGLFQLSAAYNAGVSALHQAYQTAVGAIANQVSAAQKQVQSLSQGVTNAQANLKWAIGAWNTWQGQNITSWNNWVTGIAKNYHGQIDRQKAQLANYAQYIANYIDGVQTWATNTLTNLGFPPIGFSLSFGSVVKSVVNTAINTGKDVGQAVGGAVQGIIQGVTDAISGGANRASTWAKQQADSVRRQLNALVSDANHKLQNFRAQVNINLATLTTWIQQAQQKSAVAIAGINAQTVNAIAGYQQDLVNAQRSLADATSRLTSLQAELVTKATARAQLNNGLTALNNQRAQKLAVLNAALQQARNKATTTTASLQQQVAQAVAQANATYSKVIAGLKAPFPWLSL